MTTRTAAGVSRPAAAPCGSCPYRRDVPSGVWAADEYAKLPAYDLPTAEQPHGVFMCHQQNGRVCAGWAGCHDMDESLGLRLAGLSGVITLADVQATREYECALPLFASGQEAASHGMADMDDPSASAVRVQEKVKRRQRVSATIGRGRKSERQS